MIFFEGFNNVLLCSSREVHALIDGLNFFHRLILVDCMEEFGEEFSTQEVCLQI